MTEKKINAFENGLSHVNKQLKIWNDYLLYKNSVVGSEALSFEEWHSQHQAPASLVNALMNILTPKNKP